jgi:hypothetical protein
VAEKKGKLKYCVYRVCIGRLFTLQIVSIFEMNKGEGKVVPVLN